MLMVMMALIDNGDHENAGQALMAAMMTMMAPRHAGPADELQEKPTKQRMHRSRLADTILQ